MEYFIDGLAIRLKAPHDLSWTSRFGRVFCVFDQLISGNLGLGIEEEGRKYFIKYAGAPTLGYAGDPRLAAESLRRADDIYQELRHRCLTSRLEAFETRNGFGVVFPWFEGFALAPMDIHMRQLRSLPLAARFALFDGLAEFIALASARDYITSGIADQNILVDFKREQAIFCSVDHFLRMPARNERGRLPGSPWFLAPEAYEAGAKLGETANVYQLGMLAHTFLGSRASPSPRQWEGTPALYAVAEKAIHPDPARRYQEAGHFLAAWRQAVMDIPGRWFTG